MRQFLINALLVICCLGVQRTHAADPEMTRGRFAEYNTLRSQIINGDVVLFRQSGQSGAVVCKESIDLCIHEKRAIPMSSLPGDRSVYRKILVSYLLNPESLRLIARNEGKIVVKLPNVEYDKAFNIFFYNDEHHLLDKFTQHDTNELVQCTWYIHEPIWQQITRSAAAATTCTAEAAVSTTTTTQTLAPDTRNSDDMSAELKAVHSATRKRPNPRKTQRFKKLDTRQTE